MKKKWSINLKICFLSLSIGLILSCQPARDESSNSFEAIPLFNAQNAYFSDLNRGQLYPSDGPMLNWHMIAPVYREFSLKNPNSGALCSSVMIGPNAILTSAHCINDTNEVKEVWFTTNSINPKYLKWKARVKRVFLHPEYKKTPHPVDKVSYDIAIVFIHLEDLPPAALKALKIIQLMDEKTGQINANTVFTIFAWGAQGGPWGNPSHDGQLRRLALPGEVSLKRNGHWIVIKNTSKTWRLCAGDSGGPLIFIVPTTNRGIVVSRYYVAGVFSQVADLSSGSPNWCENYESMRFTSILPHRQWIINTVINFSLDHVASDDSF